MIKLTKTDGLPVYLAPEHIRAVTREMKSPFSERGREYITKVYEESESCWWVRETPEEVARKVLDYRLFMEQYKAAHHRGSPDDAKYVLWDLLKFLEKEKSTAGTVE